MPKRSRADAFDGPAATRLQALFRGRMGRRRASGVRRTAARRGAYWQRKHYPSSAYYKRYYSRGPESLAKYGDSYKYATQEQRAARKADMMYGRGMYTGDGGYWGDLWKRTLGRKQFRTGLFDALAVGGSAVFPQFAPGIAAARAGLKASGLGSYNLSSNALVNGGVSSSFQAPTFGPISDTGAIEITHREYVGNIYAPSEDEEQFKRQTFDINPGLSKLFPWLSQLAANYDTYCLKQMMVSYKSTVSDFQTTTGVVGQVMMATQYNQAEREFESKAEIMQYHGSVSSKTSENAILGIECSDPKTAGDDTKFVRYEGLSQDQDLKDYDKGRVTVATADVPDKLAGQAIGELWVTYTVVLMHPKVLTGKADAVQQDLIVQTPAQHFFPWTGTHHAANPMGTVQTRLWGDASKAVYSAEANSIGCLVRDLEEDSSLGTSSQAALPYEMDIIGLCGQPQSLSRSRPGGIEITFPANYEGRVKVQLTYRLLAPGNPSPFEAGGGGSSHLDASLKDYISGLCICKKGEVTLVKDICDGLICYPLNSELSDTTKYKDQTMYPIGTVTQNSETVANPQWIPTQVNAGARGFKTSSYSQQTRYHNTASVHIEVHVEVRQAVRGIDNKLIIVAQGNFAASASTATTEGQCQQATLLISEYNDATNENLAGALRDASGHALAIGINI